MPGYTLDNADAHLRRSVTELDAALAQLRHAIDIATYWHDEMTAGGMLGIAEGFTKILESSEAIRLRITGMTSAITAQAAVIRTISDRTTPERVIAVLTPITHALDTVRAAGHAAIVSADNQSDLITRRLRGGKPADLLHLTTTTRQCISHAHNHLHTANTVIRAAIHLAHEAGGDMDAAPMVPHETETDAHTGLPEPVADDRAGRRVVEEDPNEENAWENYRRRNIRASPDVQDAVTGAGQHLQDGWGLRPTGQHVGTPSGPVGQPQMPATASWGDLATGIAAALVVIGEGVRRAMRHWRDSREWKERDGDG